MITCPSFGLPVKHWLIASSGTYTVHEHVTYSSASNVVMWY